MAWAKGIRHMLGGTRPPEQADFIKTELDLLDTSSLEAIRRVRDKEEQHKLLIKKLRLCTIICDFRLAQEYNNVDEKKRIFNKASMLHEIKRYLKKQKGWNTLAVITQIFETISANLFRAMPDSYHIEHLMGVDHYVPITYTLPSWQHLEIVYEILSITFSNTDIEQLLLTEYIKKYAFINNFVYLLNTLDKNERHQIQSVLELFYDEHGNIFEAELIYHLVNYCTDFIHHQVGSADGIQSILNILNSMSVIDREIYENILMPLHKLDYQHFRCYEFVLWIYCKRIIEDDEELSLILFLNILRYWPKTNVAKEQQFLKKIAVILDFIDEDIWRECDEQSNPQQYELLKRIAYKILYCLQTVHHYKTIIDILDIIEQEEVQEFVDKYGGEHLWCCIYQALFDVVTHFFYRETIHKTRDTMLILKEQDEIPIKYAHIFEQIEANQIRMFPLKPQRKAKEEAKATKRRAKYQQLRRVAHSSPLFEKVQNRRKEEEKERVELEDRERSLQRQRTANQNKKAQGLSTPQLYAAPAPPSPPAPKYKPPVPMKSKKMPNISLTTISKSKALKRKQKYVITPKQKQNRKGKRTKSYKLRIQPKSQSPSPQPVVETRPLQQQQHINTKSNRNTANTHTQLRIAGHTPKTKGKLKKTQSMGFILKKKQKKAPKKKTLPMLPAHNSVNVFDDMRYDEDEMERMKQMDKKKGNKLPNKRLRTRKSIDIDRRSGSISNPVPPQTDSQPQLVSKYKQIVSNNQRNDYLNTEYYVPMTFTETSKPLPPQKKLNFTASPPTQPKMTMLAPSGVPSLAISYSADASPSPNSIPVMTATQNGRSRRNQHIKAKSLFASEEPRLLRARTPPNKKLPPAAAKGGRPQNLRAKGHSPLSPHNKTVSMGALFPKFKPLPQHASRNKKLPPLPK